MRKTVVILSLLAGKVAFALQASNVYFEFWPEQSNYRVRAVYTVPELQEKREMVADFRNKKEAEDFYWKIVRGGDFYLGDPKKSEFINPRMKPDPW